MLQLQKDISVRTKQFKKGGPGELKEAMLYTRSGQKAVAFKTTLVSKGLTSQERGLLASKLKVLTVP